MDAKNSFEDCQTKLDYKAGMLWKKQGGVVNKHIIIGIDEVIG